MSEPDWPPRLTDPRSVVAYDRAKVTELLNTARTRTRDISALTERLRRRDMIDGYAEMIKGLMEEQR